jgi:uncharacterized membrane protein YgcG
MRCPHCSNPVPVQHAFCERCGFSADALGAYLGHDWVHLERLTDVTHCLRLEEKRHLEVSLDDFERQFPQAFIAFYFGALPNTLNPLELGMWLLNHGAFASHQITKRNEFGAVCVIDPVTGTQGVALGYGLEALVRISDLETILTKMVPSLRNSQWGSACQQLISELSTTLRRCGKPTKRQVEAPAPSPQGGNATDYGFSLLRAGHRAVERLLKRRKEP